MNKLKDLGWSAMGGVIGIASLIGMILIFGFFVKGGAWIFENFHTIFEQVNEWVSGVILILVLLSLIPSWRQFTGTGIIIGTYVWGFSAWLLCLFVTYTLWGVAGTFIGIIFMGLGVFITAPLAILFDGQFIGAVLLSLNLASIYLLRMLGLWIASKHKDGADSQFEIGSDSEESTNLP